MSARSATYFPVLLVVLAFLHGASAEDPAPKPPPSAAKPGGSVELFSVPPVRPPQPTDIVAEVDGTKLTRGELDSELAVRFKFVDKQIKPSRRAAERGRMRHQIIQQFVMKTLLLHEANRAGIEVGPEDEKKALDKLATQLPNGVTPEDAMRESEIGAERMRAELITGLTIEKLVASRMTGKLAVTEEAVDAYLRENGDRYATPETVHARHILLASPKGEDSEVKALKRKEALALRKKLFEGADFAEVAKQHSDCPSKARGGDLGTFSRGRMVPPFEKAAFGQKVDDVGPVIETDFGYHIVQVLEHNPPSVLTREKARAKLAGKNKQEVLQQLLRTLKAKARIKPPRILDKAPSTLPQPLPSGSAAKGK